MNDRDAGSAGAAGLSYGQATHVGKVRMVNEDHLLVDESLGLWVVADGMGGHGSGDVASQVAVGHLQAECGRGICLEQAVEHAHEAVLQAGNEQLGQRGMGSTVVAVQITDGRYEIAWVGDSRAYLWDGDELLQLTTDHSFVQQMVDTGAITKEEAVRHPQRNIITQALGALGVKRLQVDTVEGAFYRQQRLLLCSDGLTTEVADADIAGVMAQDIPVQEVADRLLQMALDHGGGDNISLVVIAASPDAPDKPKDEPTQPMGP